MLLAGAILTETIFSWPGIGNWMVESIFKRDYLVVQSGLLLIALIVMVVNLIVDLLYGVINPRIRVTDEPVDRPIAPIAAAAPRASPASREFWHYFSATRGAVIGLVVFVLLVLVGDPRAAARPARARRAVPDAFLTPPVWEAGGKSALPARHRRRRPRHPLAPHPRRALLAADRRLSSSPSRSSAASRSACSPAISAAGSTSLIMRVMDIILAFPSLLLALVLVADPRPRPVNAMLAIALVLQPHFARLTRAAVMAEKNREYVDRRPRSPAPAISG